METRSGGRRNRHSQVLSLVSASSISRVGSGSPDRFSEPPCCNGLSAGPWGRGVLIAWLAVGRGWMLPGAGIGSW